MKKIFFLISAVFAFALGAAEDFVRMNPYGDLGIGKSCQLFWFHSGPEWSTNKRMNRTTLIPLPLKKNADSTELSGRYVVAPEKEFQFKAVLKKESEGVFRYSADFRSKKPVETGLLFLSMDVPVGSGFRPVIDGKEYIMPEKYKDLTIFDSSNVGGIQFQTGDKSVELKGPFTLRIQDNRRFKKECYNIRISPKKASGKLTETSLSFELRSENLKSTPIPLAGSANMGFADQIAGDGKGGWTDQGPTDDLFCMPVGKHSFGGLEFQIQNPSENNGKSCIVLSKDRVFPPSAPIEIESDKIHPYLYLLNATAWRTTFKKPIGNVILTYRDGTVHTVPVLAGIDTGNWWRPTLSYPNGLLVWTGNNAGGRVGLFATAIPLEKKVLRQVRFVPEQGVWMIAGASFANRRLDRPVEKTLTFRADNEWIAFDPVREIVPGSALDLSGTQHKPAGKFGRIIKTADGHFSFEKASEKRIRFHGTNLCQTALFPDKKESEWIAKTLVAAGYNSVRLHQFENGLRDRRSKNTLDFNPVNLDRFDYLVAQLLKHGLYLCADIYVGRPILPGDNIVECANGGTKERKILNFVSRSARDNWKEYAKRLLTHKNPYTGRSLLEEPGFYSVNLDNEAPFPQMWDQIPTMVSVVRNAYAADLKKRGITDPNAADERGKDFKEFLYRRQRLTQNEQTDYLKNTLGAKFLITNLNNATEIPALQMSRKTLDFTDAHIYHDHPNYPQQRWSVPTVYHQKSAIGGLVQAFHPHSAIRFANTPHTITELNFCNPNRYRAEGAPLTGAIAALQDWDGVYRFGFAHHTESLKKPQPIKGFDTIYDPIHMLGERIVYYLFVRGDMKVSPETVYYPIPAGNPPERFPNEFMRLCLYGQIGSKITSGKSELVLPEHFKKAMDRLTKEKRVRSLTGELEIDANALRFRVVTPKSEAFTLNGGDIDGKFMKLRNVRQFSTISVHAQDNRPLAESDVLLLLHLTNAVNTGMSFQTDAMEILEKEGGLPLLMRDGTAEAELAVGKNFSGKVEALGPDGGILESVPYEKTASGIRFQLRIRGKKGVTPAYRILRRI